MTATCTTPAPLHSLLFRNAQPDARQRWLAARVAGLAGTTTWVITTSAGLALPGATRTATTLPAALQLLREAADQLTVRRTQPHHDPLVVVIDDVDQLTDQLRRYWHTLHPDSTACPRHRHPARPAHPGPPPRPVPDRRHLPDHRLATKAPA